MNNTSQAINKQKENSFIQYEENKEKKYQFESILESSKDQQKDDESRVNEDNFMIPKKVCIRKSPEKTNYKIHKSCQGEILNIYDYYMPQKQKGQGAFGLVFQVLNQKTNQLVAIKKIKNIFLDLNDTKKIYREIKLLKFLKHKNIIKLIDIIRPENKIDYTDYYLIFEFMQTDLEKIIKSKQQLSDEHIKYIFYQLFAGVFYMHSANLIHRDLKPSNLLVNTNCELKVADLGLARKYDEISEITDYVVTRWYRAPEIMLGCSEYTKAIDIWSCGCILAELLGKTPIFKGAHFLDQIEKIFAVMGSPKQEDLKYKIEQKTQKYLDSLPQREAISFESLYPTANPLAIDLLNKMLVYNPQKRWTAGQCIKHPYFESINKQSPNIQYCHENFNWDFDKIELQRHKLQEALYDESISFFDENNFL